VLSSFVVGLEGIGLLFLLSMIEAALSKVGSISLKRYALFISLWMNNRERVIKLFVSF
jgi:hypothetical protein